MLMRMNFLKIRRLRAHKKSVIAGGLIGVVAIAGIIAGVYFFSVDLYPSHDYIVPGVPPPVPLDRIMKIGVLDDMNYISGDHAWKGAYLAAKEINEGGGILVNGNQYYIGLVGGHTNEVYGPMTDGIITAEYMINNHDPQFIIGGIIYPALEMYLEPIMDNKIPFLTTGTATYDLCEKVSNDYERYKYIFRIMPLNDIGLFRNILRHIVSLVSHLNLTYGVTVDKIAFLHEDNNYINVLVQGLKDFLPSFNITDVLFPLTASLADFETCWNQIKTAKAQITCIFNINFLDQLGALIAQAYQKVKPQCLFFSAANILAQTPSYWDDAEGYCQFEIVIQSIHNTSKTDLTIPFFNSFVRDYGGEPFYTGTGSYDAVQLLAWAVNDSQSFNSDTIVKTLEKINASNPFSAAGGLTAFSPSHDLELDYPFGYSVLCQYKYIDGTKVVIPSSLNYPDFIATDSLRLPYWGINGLLAKPPQPPGNFTMNSTAESPDLDGKFNLTWTESIGADNYSVYMSDSPIEYISKKFDLLDYQTATTPFSMSLKKGEYYFRVVAYNETGETMSLDDVHVSIPGPDAFSLDSNAGDPDTDGNFDLSWMDSERAVNYSVFRYHKKITSINESLTLISDQTTATSYYVTGLPNGKYYFAVAAYNEMGYTLSNWVEIVVQISPLPIIFIISISSLVGVASIGLGWRYLKHKAEKKLKRERQEPIIVEDMKREPFEREKPGEKKKNRRK